MAASIAGRSPLLRALSRVSAKAVPRRPYSSVPSHIPSLIPCRTPIAYPPSIRLLRRELSSFKPVHSVIASACLVSKLPTEDIHSSEDGVNEWMESYESEKQIPQPQRRILY